jgi:two-component system response regulator DevR
VEPIKILIVDEHVHVRCALAERLSQSAQIEVIGHTGTVDEILEGVREKHPDLVLIEVKRSDGMGLEIVRQLSNMIGGPKLFVLTTYPSRWEREAAMRAGAHMYLLKDIETGELMEHITLVR